MGTAAAAPASSSDPAVAFAQVEGSPPAFAQLDITGGADPAPPLREAPPDTPEQEKRKRALSAVILTALAIAAVSVVVSGSGNAPQRPAAGGGPGGGIRCGLCGLFRSLDKSKACKGCARKAARSGS